MRKKHMRCFLLSIAFTAMSELALDAEAFEFHKQWIQIIHRITLCQSLASGLSTGSPL